MTLDLVVPQESGDEARLAALTVLAQQVRELVDAVVLTDVPEDEVTAVTAEIVALADRLNATRRATPLPHEFGPDGRFRHLGNAVTGEANPHALPLVIERTADGVSRAEVTFRPAHEGPPGSVHGGVSAMILDHLLGDAVATSGRPSVTGTLSIRYRQPVPYGEPLVASAAVSRGEGRKTWADGAIVSSEGKTLVEATALFITPAQWMDGYQPTENG
ncbi:PaaI family thioesterase [Sphaerisporangium flaviroseum]|uniref:Acyl-coenzyme A thioesterase THEM4 n=1 Tax=Sphaerisporangium flaviroseum TaxID=509199 RepID=A0ABP7I3V5_9ACTN